jgi:hypothetical protein
MLPVSLGCSFLIVSSVFFNGYLCCFFPLFLFTIVLSILRRFTTSHYSYGIFKPSFVVYCMHSHIPGI